jgi:hypothetical protein
METRFVPSSRAARRVNRCGLPDGHQFEMLGDRLTQWKEAPYFPMETMKQMRDSARATAANAPKPSSKPDGKGADAAKPR